MGLGQQKIDDFLEPGEARQRELRGGLACSFCDADQQDVAKLIAGPGVYICDRCIADAGVLLLWSGLRTRA